MRSFYFDNEKKNLKRIVIENTIIVFLSGVIGAITGCKMIERFIEGEMVVGFIYLFTTAIWVSIAVVEIVYLRKFIGLSLDFLRDMFKINETYRKQDIERLENEVKELQDELGKFKNTEV